MLDDPDFRHVSDPLQVRGNLVSALAVVLAAYWGYIGIARMRSQHSDFRRDSVSGIEGAP
jgi:hypothetical protein